jgi:hypothetical protein
MTKERVIIFEGEDEFILPKNRVRNKKTGISYYVPDEMNVIAPVGGGGELPPPIEPPPQPDNIDISPKTTTTQEEERKKETTVPDDVTPLPKGGDGKGLSEPTFDSKSKEKSDDTKNEPCAQYTIYDVSDSTSSSFSYIACGSSTPSIISMSDGGDEVTVCAKLNSVQTVSGRIEIQGGQPCGSRPNPNPNPNPDTETTTSTTTTTTTINPLFIIPIDLGVSPSRGGGGFFGGGGGSGGAKEGAAAKKKNLFQKYCT